MKRTCAVMGAFLVFTLSATPSQATEPPLQLSVERAGDTLTVWFENTSEETIIIYFDSRQVELTLMDGRRRLGRCRAPSGSLPRQPDERRFIAISPGQRVGEEVDLRFLCYGALMSRAERAATIAVSYRTRFSRDRYGNPTWSRRLGPIDAQDTVPADSADQGSDSDDGSVIASPLSLHRLGRDLDVTTGIALPVTLEIRGQHRSRLPVVVRPEQFRFTVSRPNGDITHCRMASSGVRPLREFYSVLGRRRMGLDMSAFCPRRTFVDSGVYEVIPGFSSGHHGLDVGLNAWTGDVEGRPFLVRIRRSGRSAGDPVEQSSPLFIFNGGDEPDAR